ncbi:MAG: hypothetical protein DRI90_11535 [Deltaproteobacteria bacterium]|nr:MAG: hypothetical protein DRI90_11535 [Deltaproteobacteria bacterium]
MNSKLDEAWLATADSCYRYPPAQAKDSPAVGYAFAAVLALIACAALAAGIYVVGGGVLTTQTGAPMSPWVFVGSAGVCAVLSGIVLLVAKAHRKSMHRLARCRESLSLALREHGSSLGNSLQLGRWLVDHWRGEYPLLSFYETPSILRAALQLEGLPVLIDVAPVGFFPSSGANGSSFWARVTVAADLPGGTVLLDANDPAVQRVRARGYEPTAEIGGLVARAPDTMEKTLVQQPESIRDIVIVGADLAAIARLRSSTESAELQSGADRESSSELRAPRLESH